MNPNQKRYFDNLDALRFFAFGMVFLSHGFFELPVGEGTQKLNVLSSFSHLGRLGVDFFFVLSSFLITWIILEERKATGGFRTGFFLIRRSLRIWPLYFLIVMFGYSVIFLQQQLTPSPMAHENPSPWWFVFFIVNFYIVQHGDSFLFFLVFLWSIAIEEQFYLFWATVMRWFREWLALLCYTLILSSLIYRYFHLDQSRDLYFHTLSALGNFGVGALTALFCYRQESNFQRICELPKIFIVSGYLLLFACIIFYESIFNFRWLMVNERLFFSLLFAFVISEQCFCTNSFYKAGKFPALNYLGKISYGLYCYHGLVITIVTQAFVFTGNGWHNGWIVAAMGLMFFSLTVLVAHISYRFYEGKFLEWKRDYY